MKHREQTVIGLTNILEEPYRIWFPTALLVGFVGVLLWPLHLLGWMAYPAFPHIWLMTLGFFGGFIFGFFWTAFPRLLGVQHLSAFEAAVQFALWLAAMISLLLMHAVLAWTLMLALLIVTGLCVVVRWKGRQDTPPPGLVLAGFGFLSLGVGLLMELATAWGLPIPLSGSRLLAWYLVHTAFPLFLFLGVAPYFFPKIMGTPNRHEFDESRSLPKGWLPIALMGALAAIVMLTGIFLKAQGQSLGAWLIAFAAISWGMAEIPIAPVKAARGSISHSAMLGLILLYLSLLGAAALPEWRVAWFHQIMTGGITLCLVMVAIRVVYGHSGDKACCLGKHNWVRVIVVFLVTASLLRMIADLIPSTRNILLGIAAVAFLLCLVVWSASMATRFFKPEVE